MSGVTGNLPQRSRPCQGERGRASGGTLWARPVRLALRLVNVLVAFVTLASALAVLVSDLRARRPLLGRAVTAAPMAATVFFLWTFFALQREETRTFSAEAQDIARLVYESLDCDAVRAHAGTTTSEVRQRGERLYQVEIAYGCTRTRVRVRAEDGRIGTVAGPQLQCCREGS